MKRNRTIATTDKRAASAAMTSTKLALLTMGAKKAAELWQSRRQPPPPPSLWQRLGGPAKVSLAAVGVGGVAYFAARGGLVSQVKGWAGRPFGKGSEQAAREMERDLVVERTTTEPPPKIVNTEPASSPAPGPPPSMP